MNNDTGLAQELSRLEKDLVAMKTSQPTGSSSVRAYETLTNFVWDYDYTMTSANYNGINYFDGFSVVFTSRNQSAPFASIRLIAEVNGQRYNSLSSRNRFGGITNAPDNASIMVDDERYNSGNLSDYAKDNILRWVVNVNSNSVGTTFKIKIIVTATDQGKIELTRFRTYT